MQDAPRRNPYLQRLQMGDILKSNQLFREEDSQATVQLVHFINITLTITQVHFINYIL